LFETFRTHALGHPFLLWLICLAVCWRGRNALSRLAGTGSVRTRAAVAATAGFVASVLVYVVLPAYFDHVEPSVAAASWVVMQGQAAYPSPLGAEMRGLPYGPALFLMNGAALTLVGPGIPASKLAGAAAAMASLVVIALAARRQGSTGAVSWTALCCLAFGATAFWVRAEPLLLLCSSLALLGVTLPAMPSAVAIGFALGLGINLKVSAVIYLLPAVLVFWRRHCAAKVALAGIIAALTASLPFVLDNISLEGYAYWIGTATGHGIRWASIPRAVEWAAFLGVPVVGALRAGAPRASKPFALALLASLAISVPLAAKHGTGIYHFLPFVPAVALAGAGIREPARTTALAWLLSLTVLAIVQVPHWLSITIALPAREVADELQAIDAKYAGDVAMGYGRSYRVSFFRPLLVFAGNEHVLDGASLMDWHWSGRVLPEPAIDAMRACRVQAWVFPRGSAPFALQSAYPIEGDVFPDRLREAFLERYRLVESGTWFDTWVCR
jgi:hypothetical protein